MLTTQEAADAVRVKAVTIRKWISEGRLRATRFGKAWQVDPKDLEGLEPGKPGPKSKAAA
jgi:excisionase family DNA binding protein